MEAAVLRLDLSKGSKTLELIGAIALTEKLNRTAVA
jgi:hypothetical protein